MGSTARIKFKQTYSSSKVGIIVKAGEIIEIPIQGSKPIERDVLEYFKNKMGLKYTSDLGLNTSVQSWEVV
ncbi:hypothetical protein ACFQZF_06070 [Flavobacterium myungsuense]|uniref:Uncharacterized protein n=1 Tax=Flavobacterium myungsuense TaxID=651823 RepID=A0ABW3J2E1_9FLAO